MCVCVCVCVCSSVHLSVCLSVYTSLGGDMHSNERLLAITYRFQNLEPFFERLDRLTLDFDYE